MNDLHDLHLEFNDQEMVLGFDAGSISILWNEHGEPEVRVWNHKNEPALGSDDPKWQGQTVFVLPLEGS